MDQNLEGRAQFLDQGWSRCPCTWFLVSMTRNTVQTITGAEEGRFIHYKVEPDL